ncbi:unnamed protein product [Allacma fusca]|uniref:Aldehyde dehydrogenase n=1 Tax=Allacma fusca TaxID=39272 RepID=A0A8J2LP74_9HEXA|nr:unnamed protein product [Allacma fusca]
MAAIVKSAREAFATGKTLPMSFRRKQLEGLLRMYDEGKQEIMDALKQDLRKTTFEGTLYEIEILKTDVKGILRNLKDWTKEEQLPFNALSFTDNASVHKDPLGVVLILGTWNYPFVMALQPLAGAIAAGNCAVIKPSEVSANSSATIARLLPRYLDKDCYKVFEGDVTATITLLEEKFDYIFATGSVAVGRSVMAAAAKHLTPVTLELGGKSPTYIDDSVNMERTVKRILWGKLINLGQTCIAPDYVLISKARQQEFLDVASKVLAEYYGDNWQKNPDLTRIINERHFNRLKKVLDATKGRVAIGGQTDQKDLWISPTIIVDVDPATDSTMEDEIFGPILPIVNVESPEAAIKFIRNRPKPLALYIFSENSDLIEKFKTKTSSGGLCVNDCVVHTGYVGLPFGGVGTSGMGNYHGKYTVDTFCHKKAVLQRGISAVSEKLGDSRYPPYTNGKIKLMSFGIGAIHKFDVTYNKFVTHALAAALGAGILFAGLALKSL